MYSDVIWIICSISKVIENTDKIILIDKTKRSLNEESSCGIHDLIRNNCIICFTAKESPQCQLTRKNTNSTIRCKQDISIIFNPKCFNIRLRVKDPKESTKFYSFLGLSVVQKLEFPESKFDLYFLGFDSSEAPSRNRHWTDREGLIELTHNYGTELDDGFKIANGNSKPGKGFGHVAVSVDNIHAACQRIEDAGYSFQKKLNDGRMKSIAFALDPDGYWVELLSQRSVEETAHVSTTILSTYRMVCPNSFLQR